MKLSCALSALPTYAHDLELKLQGVRLGTGRLEFTEETFFFKISLFSPVDMGIRSLKVKLVSAGTPHEQDALVDLSGWTLIKSLPEMRQQRINMNDLSLWGDVRKHGVSGGLHKDGWIAIRVNGLHQIESLSLVKLSMEIAGSPCLYRFSFDEWEVPEDPILSQAMLEYRSG